MMPSSVDVEVRRLSVCASMHPQCISRGRVTITNVLRASVAVCAVDTFCCESPVRQAAPTSRDAEMRGS